MHGTLHHTYIMMKPLSFPSHHMSFLLSPRNSYGPILSNFPSFLLSCCLPPIGHFSRTNSFPHTPIFYYSPLPPYFIRALFSRYGLYIQCTIFLILDMSFDLVFLRTCSLFLFYIYIFQIRHILHDIFQRKKRLILVLTIECSVSMLNFPQPNIIIGDFHIVETPLIR